MGECHRERPSDGPWRWHLNAKFPFISFALDNITKLHLSMDQYGKLSRCIIHQGRVLTKVSGHHPPMHQPESCNTGSESCLKMAHQWLSACVEDHKECVSEEDASWLPSRLVHVGSVNPARDPRLCLKEDYPPTLRYLTLSHCWGKFLALKLTESTLQQFRRTIPPSALPKTYLDALHIVRSLGYEYIWIDSLCIIQDSKEDWRNECATMGLVYKNGICNIAAAAAADGSGGCFMERCPGSFQPLVIKTAGVNGVAVWEIPTEQILGYNRWGDKWDMPLYQRGWVLQEWFLAPRILHFAQHQILWECNQGNADEGRPTLRPEGTMMAQLRIFPNFFQSATIWSILVREYTGKSLTRSTDRLPALSGIAKEMGKHFGFDGNSGVTYLAGLWSRCFAQQLTWTLGFSEPASRVIGRAPSWSWASLDGSQIDMPRMDEWRDSQALVDIIHHETFPVGTDPFQEVTGGLLRMRGWLWKMNWPAYWETLFRSELPLCSSGKHFILNGRLDTREMPPDEKEVFLLPMLPRKAVSRGGDLLLLDGLVLVKTKSTLCQFTRVGSFSLDGEAMPLPPHPSGSPHDIDLFPFVFRAVKWADESLREFGVYKPDEGDYEECTKHSEFQTGQAPILSEYMYTVSIV